MRIGVLGCGRIGALHVANLAANEAVRAVVVYDADPTVAARAGGSDKVVVVDSAEAVLESGVEGIVVATPSHHHVADVERAVRRGLSVFCEKPLATSMEQTVALRDLARRQGAVLQVGFQRRFDRGYQRLRRACASGELGFVHTLRAISSDHRPPDFGYLPGSGGLFRDCSLHDFDIVMWVTGESVVEVQSFGSNLGDPFFSECADIDTGISLLRLSDGSLATVTAARYNGAGYDVRLEVSGSERSMCAGMREDLALESADVDDGASTPVFSFLDRFSEAYRRECDRFVDRVAGRDAPVPGPDDAIAALAVADAAQASLLSGRPVKVELPPQ